MCRSLKLSLAKVKIKFYIKTDLAKKNLWELLDARVLHIFEITAKFFFF